MNLGKSYVIRIEDRTLLHFVKGLIPRAYKFLYFAYSRWLARKKGAKIGKSAVFPIRLAKKMNSNITIGNYSSVESLWLDNRCPINIGNHVIISFDTKLVTLSHHIDHPEWDFKHYGLVVDDYVWIASNAIVMPSCQHIGYGAVVGGGSLCVKDIPSMAVVGGNPAKVIGQRPCIHSELVVISLMGGDLIEYWKTWIGARKRNI